MISREKYWSRWENAGYALLVEFQARSLNSDGCSGVPDFYLLGCHEHDIAYRTGKDPLGFAIDKDEADKRLRWYIQLRSPFGLLSPMSWWRWFGLRLLGTKAWKQEKRPLPSPSPFILTALFVGGNS